MKQKIGLLPSKNVLVTALCFTIMSIYRLKIFKHFDHVFILRNSDGEIPIKRLNIRRNEPLSEYPTLLAIVSIDELVSISIMQAF